MKLYKIIFSSALLLLGACSDSEPQNEITPNQFKPLTLPASQSRVASTANNFGIKIFDATVKNQGDENVLISPLSANIVLSMIANATGAYTHQELTSALGFANDLEALNEYNKSMLEYLPSADNTAELYLPNSFWFTNEVIKDDFKSQLSNYFSADIKFTTPNAMVADINKWVNQKTFSNIPSILKEGEGGDFAFFNCLYFKGTWEVDFDKLNTKTDVFFNFDGSVSKVDFLSREASVRNGGGDNYSAISYPFGNGAFTLDVYLPDEGFSTADVMENICTTGLCNFQYQSALNLKLPKIDMNKSTDLIPVLESIGIHDIFNDGANFSKMTDFSTYAIGIFRQATAIELNEEGVKAAAATVAVGWVTSPGPIIEKFIVDRPFIFMVREVSTNSILLAGRINKL